MEDKKRGMPANALIFGLMTGVTIVILSIGLLATDKFTSGLQNLSYLIMIAGICIGTLNFREKLNGGFITYGKAVGSGVLISVFSGLVLGIFMFVYVKYINTEFLESAMTKAREQMEARGGMTDEQMNQAEKITRMMTTPPLMLIFSVIGQTFWGTLISLITSIFLRKDPPPFDNTIDQPLQ